MVRCLLRGNDRPLDDDQQQHLRTLQNIIARDEDTPTDIVLFDTIDERQRQETTGHRVRYLLTYALSMMMPEDVLFTARNCFNLWRTPLDNSDILMFQRLHNDIVNIDREMVLQEYYCCVCFEVRFICVLFIVFNSLIAVCLVRSLMNSSVFDLGRVMSRKECLVTVCVCPAMTQNARISLTLFVSLTSARLAVLFCWRIHKSTQTRVSCFLREIIRKLKMKTGTL